MSSKTRDGEGNGNPLQYSCLENPTDGGAWRATVHGVARVGHDLATKPAPPRRDPEHPLSVCEDPGGDTVRGQEEGPHQGVSAPVLNPGLWLGTCFPAPVILCTGPVRTPGRNNCSPLIPGGLRAFTPRLC